MAARWDEVIPLNPESAQAICGWVRSNEEKTLFGGTDLPWPLSAEDLLAMADDAGREVRVLLDHSRVVVATGSVLFTPDGAARIGRVLVDPERRGEGFGRAMVEALVAEVGDRRDVGVIRLGVYEHNEAARTLYKSLGFKATRKSVGAATVGGERWVNVEMERAVSRSPARPHTLTS